MNATLANKKICIIGAGNMAEALVRGIESSGMISLDNICLVENNPRRRQFMQEHYQVYVADEIGKVNRDIDILALAVKPQQMVELLNLLRDSWNLHGTLIISIAAGLPIKLYEDLLGADLSIIRVMPNMGALVLKSISALAANKNVSEQYLSMAVSLLECVGTVVRVEENMLDAVTAISGSGPAYFFYLMEILIDAAKELQLDDQTSSKLVKMTALSSAELVLNDTLEPAVLRKKVTSPGGTTEAAIRVFEKQKIKSIIMEGVKAAYQRSIDISKEAR